MPHDAPVCGCVFSFLFFFYTSAVLFVPFLLVFFLSGRPSPLLVHAGRRAKILATLFLYFLFYFFFSPRQVRTSTMEPRDVNILSTGIRSVSSTLPRPSFNTSPSSISFKDDIKIESNTKGHGIMQSRIPVRSLMANFENPPSGPSRDPYPPTRPLGRRYDPRAAHTLTSTRKVNAIIQQAPESPRKSPALRRKFPQTQLPASSSPTPPSRPGSSNACPLSPGMTQRMDPATGPATFAIPLSPSHSSQTELLRQQTSAPNPQTNTLSSHPDQSCTISQLIAWPRDDSPPPGGQAFSPTLVPGSWPETDTGISGPSLSPRRTAKDPPAALSSLIVDTASFSIPSPRNRTVSDTIPVVDHQTSLLETLSRGEPVALADETVSGPSERNANPVEDCPDDSDDCSLHSESSPEALDDFYGSVEARQPPLPHFASPSRPLSAKSPVHITQASAAIAMSEASSFHSPMSPKSPIQQTLLTVPDPDVAQISGSSCDLDDDDWEERVSSTIYPSESASMVGTIRPVPVPVNPSPVAYEQSSPTRARQYISRPFFPPPLKKFEMAQICPEPILSPRPETSPEPSPEYEHYPRKVVPKPRQDQPASPRPVLSAPFFVDAATEPLVSEDSTFGFYRRDEKLHSPRRRIPHQDIGRAPPLLPLKDSLQPSHLVLGKSGLDTRGRPSVESESYSNLYHKLLPDPPVANDLGLLVSPKPFLSRAASAVSLREQMATAAAAAVVVAGSQSEATVSASLNGAPVVERSEKLKKLIERRHILKEIVDTERSLHTDMIILNNIYKGTSEGVLSEVDRRTLFGNIEQVCALTGKLSDAFKFAADPRYAAKREGRRGEVAQAVDHVYPTAPFTEWPEDELIHFDVRTEVGHVFCENMPDIYEVYGYYLKNHTWANSKLADLESDRGVAVWLETCRASASDLTSAWNLNALLVKPMQRVTKYPLMLRNLLRASAPDHPDRARIEKAVGDLEEKLRLWNETQDGGPMKKESDLLPKLVNRRAEKTKQQVGITNSLEDPEYDKLSQRFGGHFFQLQIVIRDVNAHIDTLQNNMSRHTSFVAAAEMFCRFDQQATHPEAQSGLVTYSRIVTDMATVGLPRHIAGIRKHVLDPLEQLWRLNQGPQELMRRRKKRGVEYVRWRQLVGRGETPDRKLREAAEQFKTTNDRLKDELPKLYDLSRRLVKACLDNLITLQSQWHDNWVRKLDLAAREPERSEDVGADLKRIGEEYVADFACVESRLRELGLCTGNIRSFADPSGYLKSPSTSSDEPGSGLVPSRGRAATITSSHRTGSAKSDVDANRLSATTLGSMFGRSAVDVGSASARSSRGPITPQSGSHQPRPALSKAPSFGSNRSGRHGQTRAGTSNGAQPSLVRSLSGAGGTPRLLLDLGGSSLDDEFSAQAFGFDDGSRVVVGGGGGGPIQPQPIWSSRSLSSPYGHGAANPMWSPTTANPFSSVMPVDAEDGSARLAHRGGVGGGHGDGDDDDDVASTTSGIEPGEDVSGYKVLFVAASLYEFQVEDSRSFVGFPYLQYTTGEIFDVIGQNGELWMARNQDDPDRRVGWIWERHFARILPEDDDLE